MRCFLGLFPPPAIQQGLYDAVRPLRRDVDWVRWIHAAKLHVTLKFLGEVKADELQAIQAALLQRTFPTFALAMSGLGCFPQHGQPRVVWAGLQGDLAALSTLVAELEDRLSSLGFAQEDRPFQPHLTLGRVPRRFQRSRHQEAGEELRSLLAAASPSLGSATFPVPAFQLVHSDRGNYRLLQAFTLPPVAER